MDVSGWSADEDAKRVPGGVGVDPQRLLRVIRAVLEQPGAERERPLMRDVEVSRGGHRGIQVQLLRDRAVRPGCPGQLPDLLKRQRRAAGRAPQHQPVLPFRVRLAGPGRLIARAVPQAEQLPVELGQPPRVGGVQHRLPDDRERLLIVHTATVGRVRSIKLRSRQLPAIVHHRSMHPNIGKKNATVEGT